MRVALDKDGKRAHINQAHVKDIYFCPTCGEQLIIKRGEQRENHFAHKANSQCNDGWHYEMSEWHSAWQDKFPLECQEVVKRHNGKIHRADVLIESTKTVIEFQHSPMSPEEFDDRNSFYRELGYKVVWLFDAIDQYEDSSIAEHETKNNIFIWKRPRNTFNHLSSISNEDNIYLELEPSALDNPRIEEGKEKMAKHPDIDDLLGTDEDYLNAQKEDIGYIAKVAWIPPSGFERFAANEYFSTDEFVNQFSGIVKEKKHTLEDVFDKPRYLYSKDHTSYYDGCPVSNTRKCANSTIDIPKEYYKEIMPCCECKYGKYNNKVNQCVCYKKIIDLNLPKNAEISNIERYDEYSLKSLTVNMNGQEKKINFNPLTYSNIGESVFDLWKKTNPSVAIFRNIRTGYFIKITRNPQEQNSRYHKVFGYFSKDQYTFNGQANELYSLDKKEWVIVWKK